jgi:ferredoxin
VATATAVAAPDVFDLDDQDIAVIQDGHPTAGDQGVVADAAADCPVQAIQLMR